MPSVCISNLFQPCRKLRLRAGYLFITITLAGLANAHVHAQQITTQALPSQTAENPLPDSPQYPIAKALLPPAATDEPVLVSNTQAYRAGVYTLDGLVVITQGRRRVEADHIIYDANSGDITATGHVLVSGGVNDEILHATHATYNLRTATGRFYEVSGSVGVQPGHRSTRTVYTNNNPFLFTGRMVVKRGPQEYDIYDGTVTSCQLPTPDWVLASSHFSIDGDKARARNSVFRLVNIPVFFLPYVTAPTDAGARQTGLLIPTVGQSGKKGFIIGEQVYFAINRSMDFTIGAEYYSLIGYAQNATFRAKGRGLDFGIVHYSGVLDRRIGADNQGGEELVLAGRHDFTENTRAVVNLDYLSSYIFREAFTDTFNQAVTSDIVSTAFLTRVAAGTELSGFADRYQGIKTIAQGPTTTQPNGVPQQQVHIFHAPTISFDTTDHRVAGTGFEASIESSAAGLKRSQNNFVTGGIIERFDFHPKLAYPLAVAGFHLVPEVAARETLYTRSRVTPVAGQPPLESLAGLSRSDFEFALSIRPPVIERDFKPTRFTRILGTQLRHTVEPEITYRLTTGVNNFNNVLRFDDTDVVANTNEAEYGVTQRLFRKVARPGPCQTDRIAAEPGFNSTSSDDPSVDPTAIGATEGTAEAVTAPSTTPCTKSEALISWRLTQKYFFDPSFGGAIVTSRRNIFDTTLNLSGVAFLTEKREISPLISRLRVRTSAHTDVEWDFDLDTGARKFTSSNVFVDLHQGQAFSALSYARLDAPGRFFTQSPDPTATNTATGVSSAISDFNQLRFLIGYGNPGKPGLSLAANTGIDLKSLYGTTSTTAGPVGTGTSSVTVYPALLQYAAVQGSYNWNCCGVSLEYRKFELGSVRNDGGFKFSFTLANIGTAGNLRRAERLF